jgi:integrase
MSLMTYLLKDRHGTYYFRRVIPAALKPFMSPPWTGNANFKRSLGTKKPSVAKIEASKALRDCTIAFQSAERVMRGEPVRAAPLDDPVSLSLEDIEADTVAEVLVADEAEREEGDDRRYLQTADERAQWPDLVPVAFGRKGMTEEHDFVRGPWLAEEAQEYRRANARRDPAIIDAELRIYLRERGKPVNPTSAAYREAGLAMLRGKVRGYELVLKKQRGEIVETPPRPNVNKGPKLAEALAAWKAGGRATGTKQPGPNTVREAEYSVRRFKEWHGDLRLGDIDKAKSREFRDAMARVPTGLPQALRKLPLRELLKSRNLSKLSPASARTINKQMQLLSAVVAHAMREGRMDQTANYANPFQGIKLIVDDRGAETRVPFDAADLKAIFGTPVFTEHRRPHGGGGEAAFWLPLIALLSGARQNELAELRIEDLTQDPETGLWVFDISTEGGRSIKTASSRRKVPIHPHLVKVGLLRYRQSVMNAGSGVGGDLWPEMKSDAQGRRAGAWSKWFNRHLRLSAKVEESSKVFHSFRHTFKRMARDAGIGEELHDALTGHSGGGVGRSYGGGFGLKALAEAIGRIEVPEAVNGLEWSLHPN